MSGSNPHQTISKQILIEMGMKKEEKSNILAKITNSKEFVVYQKEKTEENKEAYQNFLKNLLVEEEVLPHFARTGTVLPARGNLSLEDYIVEITEDAKDLEKKFEDIVLLKHTEKMKAVKAEEKVQKEEKVKDLIEQLNDKSSELGEIKEENKENKKIVEESMRFIDEKEKEYKKLLREKNSVNKEQKQEYEEKLKETEDALNKALMQLRNANPQSGAYKGLNTWLMRKLKNQQGVVYMQFLSPAAALRRKRLNRLVKSINKYQDNPEKGIRYIMAMSSWYKGGRILNAPLRRGVRNMFNKNRVGKPEKFYNKYTAKIDKFIPDPGTSPYVKDAKFKNPDEWIFAKYARDWAIYYRDKFITNQQRRWGPVEEPKEPNMNKIITQSEARE